MGRKRRDRGTGGIEPTAAGTHKIVIDVGPPDLITGKRQRIRPTFKTKREPSERRGRS